MRWQICVCVYSLSSALIEVRDRIASWSQFFFLLSICCRRRREHKNLSALFENFFHRTSFSLSLSAQEFRCLRGTGKIKKFLLPWLKSEREKICKVNSKILLPSIAPISESCEEAIIYFKERLLWSTEAIYKKIPQYLNFFLSLSFFASKVVEIFFLIHLISSGRWRRCGACVWVGWIVSP